MNLKSITRYPVKGLAGEALEHTIIRANQTLIGDRQYALQHRDRIPPSTEGWRPKKFFLQSVHTDALAELQVRWSVTEASFPLDQETLNLKWPDEANALADWLSDRVADTTGLQLVECPTGFTDEPTAYVSLINAETVQAIAEITETHASEKRYRGNLLIEGVPAFAETQWVGQVLSIGDATFRVAEPIVRCRATECSWIAPREMDFLARLEAHCDTDCCGLFLIAESPGLISIGDSIRLT